MWRPNTIYTSLYQALIVTNNVKTMLLCFIDIYLYHLILFVSIKLLLLLKKKKKKIIIIIKKKKKKKASMQTRQNKGLLSSSTMIIPGESVDFWKCVWRQEAEQSFPQS